MKPTLLLVVLLTMAAPTAAAQDAYTGHDLLRRCEWYLARIIHEEADYSRKTNAPVWYKGCAHRPFATTEALA